MSLTAHALTLLRGEKRALHDVNLALLPGCVTVLIGENGAGKTTLLRALGGLDRPSLGEVRLDQRPILSIAARERAQAISSLGPDDVHRYGLTVTERIAHGLAPSRGPAALVDDATEARARAVATELGVANLMGRRVSSLSSGERRRVELASALILEAGVLLLDEPHARVDARRVGLVDDALRARARAGATVVASVHDLTVGLRLADRVIGMRDGAIVVDGPPDVAFARDNLERLFDRPGALITAPSGARAVVLD